MIHPKKLLRNDTFSKLYSAWLAEEKNNVIDQFRFDFESIAFEEKDSDSIFKQNQQQAYFLWIPSAEIDPIQGEFLLDFFKEKIIDLSYYSYLSDSRNEFIPDFGNTQVSRHYLKPLFRLKPQLENKTHYGNLFIETSESGPKPFFLKITANYYANDEHEMFEKLMEKLLGEGNL